MHYPPCSQTKTLHTVQTIPLPLQPYCLQSRERLLPLNTPTDTPAVFPQLNLLPHLSHPSPQPVSCSPLFYPPHPSQPLSSPPFWPSPSGCNRGTCRRCRPPWL